MTLMMSAMSGMKPVTNDFFLFLARNAHYLLLYRVRLAPARGIHGAASGGVVAAPSLASGLARPYSERFLRLNKYL